jgi:hypothetical protein
MNRCAMLGSQVVRYLGWTEEEVLGTTVKNDLGYHPHQPKQQHDKNTRNKSSMPVGRLDFGASDTWM